MADFISSIYSGEDDSYKEYEIKIPAKNVYYIKEMEGEEAKTYLLSDIIEHYLSFMEKFNICFEYTGEGQPDAQKGIFMLEEE